VVLCIVLGTASGQVIDYLDHAAASLHDPQEYIRTVLTQVSALRGRESP
jgi:formate hydrogenlyase subunit 3/multisubunit Na+/H+ antiporter MnhD subunit